VRPEESLEKVVCKEATEAGWRVFKLAFPGIRGAPDRMFGRGGRAVLIEFKAPGKRPTRQQIKRHDELRESCGFEVRWTDCLEDAREILGLEG